jgi:hypothetical protein
MRILSRKVLQSAVASGTSNLQIGGEHSVYVSGGNRRPFTVSKIYVTHITRYLRAGESLLFKAVIEDCIFLPTANIESVEWLATYCRREIHFSRGQKFSPF